MNVMFLDIDGVLCTARTAVAFDCSLNHMMLDPVGVKLIENICKFGNMGICISSNRWKLGCTRKDFIKTFTDMGGGDLVKYLFDGDLWKTPTTSSRDRGQEISLWLKCNSSDIKIVIDDDKFDLSSHCDYLIVPKTYEGISFDNYLSALNIVETQKNRALR